MPADCTWYRMESNYGSWSRAVTLPDASATLVTVAAEYSLGTTVYGRKGVPYFMVRERAFAPTQEPCSNTLLDVSATAETAAAEYSLA